MNVEYIAGLMEKRRPLYEGAADITIETDGKRVEAIAEEIMKGMQQ
jgi:shikimate kinase